MNERGERVTGRCPACHLSRVHRRVNSRLLFCCACGTTDIEPREVLPPNPPHKKIKPQRKPAYRGKPAAPITRGRGMRWFI
jgi:hypothetical protein